MDENSARNHGDHEELVTRAGRRDPVAVAALLEHHLPALVAYVRLKTGPLIRKHESCSDIVQSVCREVLEDVGRYEYRGEAPFRAWLFTKAVSKLVDRKRYYLAERRDPDRVEDLAALGTGCGVEALYASACGPGSSAIAREDLTLFEAAFDLLPPDYQQVILLNRIQGLSHAEVAAAMDRSEAATRTLLHRAIARLGLLMQEDAPTT